MTREWEGRTWAGGKHTTKDFAFDILDVAFPLLAVFAVPELYFEDFAGHGLRFFDCVILAEGGED